MGANEDFFHVGANQKIYPVGANQPKAIRDTPIAISQASWLNSSYMENDHRVVEVSRFI